MSKLALACEMSLNDWLATFPDEIPKAEHTKHHEKWKKNLFNKMRDDRYHRFTTKTIKVMLVAAVLFVLMLTAFVIPSSREYMMDKFENFSRYKVTQNNKNNVSGEITVGYIPDGFEFDDSIDMGKNKTNRYVNINGDFFTIIKSSSEGEVNFDTENFVSEKIIADGQEYVYCKGNLGVDNLIWTKNDYVYRISGPFSMDELIKIAKTVE